MVDTPNLDRIIAKNGKHECGCSVLPWSRSKGGVDTTLLCANHGKQYSSAMKAIKSLPTHLVEHARDEVANHYESVEGGEEHED